MIGKDAVMTMTTMKKIRRYALTAALGLAASTAMQPVRPAHAVWATSIDVWTSYIKNIAEQTANKLAIMSSISEAYLGMSASILSQAGQETQNATAQIKAQANMADAKAQFDYQNKVAGAILHAENETMSGSNNCAAITGKMSGAQLYEQQRRMRAAMTAQSNATSSGFDINNPNHMMSAQDIQKAHMAQHCADDATELDVALNVCPSVTASAGRDNTVMDMQGHPHVMIPNDQNANVFLNNSTLSPRQAAAGQRFTMLVADPHPSGQILPLLRGSSEDRQKQMQEWNRQRAVRSIAKSVISHIVAEGMVPDMNSPTQRQLQTWAENRAQTVAGYVRDPATGKYFPNGVSEYAFNELMVRGIADDLNQDILGSAQNSSATLKDIHKDLQMVIKLQWMILTQGRDRNMMEASRLSLSADEEERNNSTTAGSSQ